MGRGYITTHQQSIIIRPSQQVDPMWVTQTGQHQAARWVKTVHGASQPLEPSYQFVPAVS